MTRTPERRAPLRVRHAAAAAVLAAVLGLPACAAPGSPAGPASAGPGSAGPSSAAPAAVPAAALAAGGGSPAAPAPAAGSPDGARRLTPAVVAELDRAVRKVLRDTRAPGALVGLWTPGGRYVRALGSADRSGRTPMSPRLGFRIGSETKTFTVTALLQLVDRGRVRLDDPVSRYVEGVPGGGRITLRQLAEMRSGLFSYTEDAAFDKAFLADPHRAFTPRQLLAYAFRHPATARPGTAFQYSNTNTVLLGLVVEKASGMPLYRYLAERVMDPVRLRRTLLPIGPEFPEPHARGYTRQTPTGAVADATDWDPSWAWAAGAVISDLDDLRAWAVTAARGTLLTPATQRQRLRTLPTGAPGLGYGLGIFDLNGWIGHNGSLPGYQTVAVHLPAAGATLVVLVNTDAPAPSGGEPATLFATAVTRIVTPRHLYALPGASPSPRPSSRPPAKRPGTSGGPGASPVAAFGH
ncbi:serine hydrolase domain-containing protein [Streptomyces sp. NPDC001380]|uniref:serine hydrolase domain-containing protein n=1 Tax=Streptomyces sp. NPDC001380 TaxID=3364566 RepID=UPI0036B6AE7F